MPDLITIPLDRPRAINWTLRADARLSSVGLDFTTAVGRLNKASGLYALCALVWAALVDKDQSFTAPEDLAEYIASPEQQSAALDALRRTCLAAGLLKEDAKKNAPAAKPPAGGPGSPSRRASARPR